jgi:hypothetical protein
MCVPYTFLFYVFLVILNLVQDPSFQGIGVSYYTDNKSITIIKYKYILTIPLRVWLIIVVCLAWSITIGCKSRTSLDSGNR